MMKLLLLLAVVATATAMPFRRINMTKMTAIAPIKSAPTFKVCSGAGALLSNVVITTDSNDWKAGDRVNIILKGDLSQQVDDGELAAKAFFVGVSVLDSKDNLCMYEGTPFQCPLAKGALTVPMPFDVPSPPFAGELTANMVLTDVSGAEIVCIDFSVQLK